MKPQTKRGHAADQKAASPLGGFRKRTITPLSLVGAVASIATETPTFHKVWVKRELDPGFRETLMLAVARSNDAKYCSWAHHEWAMIEGVPEEELAHVEQMDPAQLDRKTWLAISFVRALVAANFGPVSKELCRRCGPATLPRNSTKSLSWPRSWMS
jgi:AhpD family alkylhydroperoxidase